MAFFFNSRARVAATSFVLFCGSLFLTAYSARNPAVSRYGFVVLAELQRPFQVVNSKVDTSISATWETYVNLIGVKEENDQLRKRLEVLEAANSSLLEYKYENERIRSLLELTEKGEMKGIAANVIGYDLTILTKTVYLDRGSLDGVQQEMPVVVGDGVVGQIVAVSLQSSRALLIIDPSSAVDSLVQEGRVRGLVRGAPASKLCELMYIMREEELAVGDRVITSGLDDVFPKGLLIGVISKIKPEKAGMFQSVTVEPLVDFEKLESVLIVTNGPATKTQ